MIPYVRKEKIMGILKNDDIVKIEDLQHLIPDVSISTLRRDLKELEKEDKVILLFGGGVRLISKSSELPVTTKSSMKKSEKEIIATLASEVIHNDDTIYIDSGTTCTALLNKLINKKITIITSNTEVFRLPNNFLCNIIFLGGNYNPIISSVNGSLTDDNISRFNFDKAFLGANAIDANLGVSTPSLIEATKKRQAIKRAKESYLLCDSSKFGKTLMSKAFDVEQCILITDTFNEALAEKTTLIVPKK